MDESTREFKADALRVRIFKDQPAMAQAAARETHDYLVELQNRQKEAAVILATGNSQLRFLDDLTHFGGVDWGRLTLFHMDEYLGLSRDHTASFRRYMRERVEGVVKPKAFHYLEGDALEPIKECERYEELLRRQPIDLSCLGIGENGHLAFNDPPVANFEDDRWVKVVQLDVACRMQQVNEGHFPDLESAPLYALSLTIPALCSARRMVCLSPEKRKAKAVKAALEGPVETACPASYLRTQGQATLYLDLDSAALLGGDKRSGSQ